jgi:hypothetical protein
MRKIMLASVLVATAGVVGLFAWTSNAAVKPVILPSVLPHSSAVQPASCNGPSQSGRCPPGRYWSCGAGGSCWCHLC